MAGGPVEAVPVGEEDVAAWAKWYVYQQQERMRAESASGGRPSSPGRAEVTRAVAAKFGDGSGRSLGPLTWIRILYWVAWIILALSA